MPVNYAATIGVPYALAQKIATPRNPPKNESLFLGVKRPGPGTRTVRWFTDASTI